MWLLENAKVVTVVTMILLVVYDLMYGKIAEYFQNIIKWHNGLYDQHKLPNSLFFLTFERQELEISLKSAINELENNLY